MTENKVSDTETAESKERRSFMKKGALAASALALGLGSAGSGSAQAQEALVYMYDYHPNVPFRVTNALQQSTTIRLLRRVGGGNVPEISQPDDYDGWIIRYELGGENAALTTFMFARNVNVSTGDRRQFAPDATVFSSSLNLLSTRLRSAGGDGGGGGGQTTTTTTETEGGQGNSSA
ncbi:twin-arginine translocation signal domain-containing protein [Haladaptatus sp. NG-SE-30]